MVRPESEVSRLRTGAGAGFGKRTSHQVTPAAAASKRATAGIGSQRGNRLRVPDTGAAESLPESDSSFSSSSAIFTSPMCWNRRPASLRRQRAMSFSRS